MQQEQKTLTQNKLKQLESPGLVASYDLQPGNGFYCSRGSTRGQYVAEVSARLQAPFWHTQWPMTSFLLHPVGLHAYISKIQLTYFKSWMVTQCSGSMTGSHLSSSNGNTTTNHALALSCWLVNIHCWSGARKSIRPVKNWAMRCWRGYLSAARCKWFPYGPADATATHIISCFVKPRLHDTTCCQNCCQTGLTTSLTTGWMFVYTIQPVVKPVAQPVVSCKRGIKIQTGLTLCRLTQVVLEKRPLNACLSVCLSVVDWL